MLDYQADWVPMAVVVAVAELLEELLEEYFQLHRLQLWWPPWPSLGAVEAAVR